MAAISYEYYSFKFGRKSIEPLTQKEYELVRLDYENFVSDFLEESAENLENIQNPHKFNWKVFGISLGLAGGLIGLSLLLGHFNIMDTFASIIGIIGFMIGLSVFFQPFQYLMSATKTESSHVTFEIESTNYYKFHRLKVMASKDFEDYLNIIQRTTDKEFVNFMWKDLWKDKNEF